MSEFTGEVDYRKTIVEIDPITGKKRDCGEDDPYYGKHYLNVLSWLTEAVRPHLGGFAEGVEMVADLGCGDLKELCALADFFEGAMIFGQDLNREALKRAELVSEYEKIGRVFLIQRDAVEGIGPEEFEVDFDLCILRHCPMYKPWMDLARILVNVREISAGRHIMRNFVF